MDSANSEIYCCAVFVWVKNIIILRRANYGFEIAQYSRVIWNKSHMDDGDIIYLEVCHLSHHRV